MEDKTNKDLIIISTEQRIIHHLILYSSSSKNIGLLEGKMGVIILFMHLAKNTENSIYENIAEDLLDEIWEEITIKTPIDFESGLSGIGWGIEYLIQNKFVEGCSLDICEEIDNKIMSWDPKRISDHSIEYGLGGLLHYILAHIKGSIQQNNRLPFDNIYLKDLSSAINTTPKNNPDNEINQLIIQYNEFFRSKHIPNYSFNLGSFVSPIEHFEENKLLTYPMGLKGGLGGILLTKLNLL